MKLDWPTLLAGSRQSHAASTHMTWPSTTLLALLTALAGTADGASLAPQMSSLRFGDTEVQVEQEFSDAEEGSVLWDCSRSFLAYVTQSSNIRGKRVLEIGAGTGAVGLALARLGADSVVVTDKSSQLPLMRRNIEHNQLSDLVRVELLTWGEDWRNHASAEVAGRGAFDVLVCCDCVYPSVSPEPLVHVLCDLLQLNPTAVLLLASEYRPPTANTPDGVDHVADFFALVRDRGLDCQRVTDAELAPEWRCEEISLWRIQSAGSAPHFK